MQVRGSSHMERGDEGAQDACRPPMDRSCLHWVRDQNSRGTSIYRQASRSSEQ
jgi:hypothetical protein